MKTNSNENFEPTLQLAENMLQSMTIHLVNVLQYSSTPAKSGNSGPPITPMDGSRTSHNI